MANEDLRKEVNDLIIDTIRDLQKRLNRIEKMIPNGACSQSVYKGLYDPEAEVDIRDQPTARDEMPPTMEELADMDDDIESHPDYDAKTDSIMARLPRRPDNDL